VHESPPGSVENLWIAWGEHVGCGPQVVDDLHRCNYYI
jgi:hypothetical protein